MTEASSRLPWRAISAVFCVLALWAAYLQLNDPDPERWFALYSACALVAGLEAARRGRWWLAAGVAVVALGWAAAIVPELVGRWSPQDLGATMSAARPEVEFGRELGGLVIVGGYCVAAWWRGRRGGLA